jgi:hypothetical protein
MGIVSAAIDKTVTLTTYRGHTTGSVRCDVYGAVCFTRARRHGFLQSLAKMLRLRDAVHFALDTDIYGSGDAALDSLKRDNMLRDAVATLLTCGAANISLGGRKLRAYFPKGVPNDSSERVKAALACVALRLEGLSGGLLNEEASITRLSIPFIAFAGLGLTSLFGEAVATSDVRLIEPMSLLPATLLVASGILLVLALCSSLLLREHALAAVALPTAFPFSCIGALLTAWAVCSGLNVTLGRRFLSDDAITISGFVTVLPQKGHPCYLRFAEPSVVDLSGKLRAGVLISCKHFDELTSGDNGIHRFKVEVNRGYLGGTFVDSIKRLPDFPPYATAPVPARLF